MGPQPRQLKFKCLQLFIDGSKLIDGLLRALLTIPGGQTDNVPDLVAVRFDVVPTSALAAARAEIAKLQRVLGKKTLEN